MALNRRIKYTKMVLNESFLHFLSEKPLSKITVKEICEEADINRSTYYTHFSDPYEQLKKLESEILHDMSVYVDELILPSSKDKQHRKQILLRILEYIESKKYTFTVLLMKNHDFDLQREILSFFGKRIFPAETHDSKAKSLSQYEYIFYSTGAFGIIYKWLEDGCELPVDAAADMIVSFTEVIGRQ